MSLEYIKKLDWQIDGNTVLKIESVNAYLGNTMSIRHIKVDIGRLCIECTSDSDMMFDQDTMQFDLIDNTDYWITYNQNENLDEVAIHKLLKKEIDGKGILNSKNYVGNLDMGISCFSIAVKSKKINYDRDFDFLRHSISDFCSDLLSRSSSYFTEHFQKTDYSIGKDVNYSEIAYLRDLLAPDKLQTWIDYFLYHTEHKYESNIEKQNLCEVDEVNVEFYMNGLLSGENFHTSKIVGNAGKCGIAPYEIQAYNFEMTYDIVENRFVKFFVFFLKDYLYDTLQNADENNRKLTNEITKMINVLEERLQNQFWQKISNMDRIPFDSQMLQKKYPYNLIFQAYTEFELSSEINLGDIDKSYAVGQKDAPMLYQYWVFIMLFKHLEKRYQKKYTTSDWLTYDGKNLTFTLTEGRKSFAKFYVDEETELHLLYNKTYDSNHAVWEGRSYSHELKPDISVELFKDEELVSIVHFDAKYRLPINGTDVPDDINKMHAYKDGIIGTIGSYAVCLADEEIIYHEEERGVATDSLFPSVGACPLNLNPNTLDRELANIMYIVDEFTKIDIENTSNRFSQKHLVSYSALMRKMMRIKEQ